MSTREKAPCGTSAAYSRHIRNGEPTDDACRAANAAYMADRRLEPKEREANKRAIYAGDSARRELARRYWDEYQELYAKHLGDRKKADR